MKKKRRKYFAYSIVLAVIIYFYLFYTIFLPYCQKKTIFTITSNCKRTYWIAPNFRNQLFSIIFTPADIVNNIVLGEKIRINTESSSPFEELEKELEALDKEDTNTLRSKYTLNDANIKKEIKKSLKKLIQQADRENFIIISVPKTYKDCAFMIDNNGLFFDLPYLPLSKAEIKRAKAVLPKHGIPKMLNRSIYDSGDKNPKRIKGWKGFQKSFGNDVDAATETVMAVFLEIYQFAPNTEIEIKESITQASTNKNQ